MIYLVYEIDIFRRQVLCLFTSLKKRFSNIEVIKLTKHTKYDDKCMYIGFFNRITRYPKNFCIYNAEAIQNDNINKAYKIKNYIDKCEMHIDYSLSQIECIRQQYPQYSNKLIYIPFGYMSNQENPPHTLVNNLSPAVYDISFVGCCNEYRTQFINHIKEHKITVLYPNMDGESIEYDKLQNIYKQSKLVLSIKYYDKVGNDFFRIRDIILSNNFVLCEKYIDEDCYEIFDKYGVTFTTKEECIERIKYWLNVSEKYRIEILHKIVKEFKERFNIDNYLPTQLYEMCINYDKTEFK